MDQYEYNENNVNVCPRCQQKLLSGNRVCLKCGYDLDQSNKTEAILSFGLKDTVIVKSDVAYKRFALVSFVGGFTIIALRLFVRRKNDEKYNDFSIK